MVFVLIALGSKAYLQLANSLFKGIKLMAQADMLISSIHNCTTNNIRSLTPAIPSTLTYTHLHSCRVLNLINNWIFGSSISVTPLNLCSYRSCSCFYKGWFGLLSFLCICYFIAYTSLSKIKLVGSFYKSRSYYHLLPRLMESNSLVFFNGKWIFKLIV